MPMWTKWFALLGGSAVVTCIVTLIFNCIVNYFRNKRSTEQRDRELLKVAMQSLLRHELYEMYYRFSKKGFSTPEEKKDFQNLYNSYHALGKNGVMDVYKDKVLNMPDGKK